MCKLLREELFIKISYRLSNIRKALEKIFKSGIKIMSSPSLSK